MSRFSQNRGGAYIHEYRNKVSKELTNWGVVLYAEGLAMLRRGCSIESVERKMRAKNQGAYICRD